MASNNPTGENSMKTQALFGTILFPDDETAIVQSVLKWETIQASTPEECQEIAEHNAGYYGGDWLIPSLYAGLIKWECMP
jgi:hypothetical protein